MTTKLFKGIMIAGMVLMLTSPAQGMFFELLSFREDTEDSTAINMEVEVEDYDYYASALKVELPVGIEEVTLSQEVFGHEVIDGYNYLFFSPEENRLTVQVPGFEDVDIFPPVREGFQPNKVYKLQIDVLQKAELTFLIEPDEEVEIFVNDEHWPDISGEVTMGIHEIFIYKEGYEEIHDVIEVNTPEIVLHYQLLPAVKE